MPILKLTRASAAETIRKLITVHEATIRDIDEGKQFWKGGVECTAVVRTACEGEIVKLRRVVEALWRMKDGDFKRAADLCNSIEEFLPNVH